MSIDYKAAVTDYIEAELSGGTVYGMAVDRFNDPEMEIEGAIFSSENNATIVFRCTDSNFNWVTNFLFAKKSIPYGNDKTDIRVHLGFYLGYSGYARGYLHAWLKAHPEISNITVTGHSLGGALSTLCAVDIQYNFSDQLVSLRCITFGSPRVGNKAFVQSFTKRVPVCMRFRYANDLVTHLPMRLLGFDHVGAFVQLGKPGFYSIKAHLLENYRDSV